MATLPFIGRTRELEFLEKRVVQAPGLGWNASATAVIGEKGSGRKKLVSQFWRKVQRKRHPFFRFLVTQEWMQSPDFLRKLADQVDSNAPQWLGLLQPEENLSGEAGDAFLADQGLGPFLVKVSETIREKEKVPIFIFFIQDYDQWSVELREEFRHQVISSCFQCGEFLSWRLFITRTPWEEEEKKSDPVLNEFGGTYRDIRLTGLNRDEVNKLLIRLKLTPSDFPDIMEETKGMPGAVETYLGDVLPQSIADPELVELGRGLLNGLDKEKTAWALAAAQLNDIQPDSLEILFPGQGQKAYSFLQEKNRSLILVPQGKHCVMHREQRSALEEFSRISRDIPLPDTEKLARVNRICRQIPTQELRDRLRYLGIFQYFNPEVVKTIYKDQQWDFEQLSKDYPGFFEIEEGTWQMSASLRPLIADLLKFHPLDSSSEIRNRISQFWAKEEIRLKALLSEADKDVESYQKASKKADSELQAILSKQKRAAHGSGRGDSSQRGRRIFLAILLEIMGIVILYFTILFNNELSLSSLLLGGLCIFLGLFLPHSQKHALVQGAGGMGANRADLPHQQLSLDLLKNRRQAFQRNHQIAREKHSLIQRKLNQPFI